MSKWTLRIGGAIVGSALIIFLVIIIVENNRRPPGKLINANAARDDLIQVPSLEYKYTKFLMVVVDGPDVFLGKDRIEKERIGEVLMKFAELNKLKAIEILGSDSASYRDVVAVIGFIDKRRVPYVTLHTRTCSSGYRGDPIQDISDW